MKTSDIARGIALTATTALAATTLAAAGPAAAQADLVLQGASADGPAFDLDEYADGDVTVQVRRGARDVDVDDSQDLRYQWLLTPFDATAPAERLPASGTDVVTDETTGRFDVPLPTAASGVYTLVAGLGPDADGAGATPRTPVLTVAAGQATLAFDEDGPLALAAGADHALGGSLVLEDGTGLRRRTVELVHTPGSAGSDRQPDATLMPTTVTTGRDGSFTATLGDSAETPQGSELGGSMEATSVIGGTVLSAGTLAVDLVTETAPAGSTLEVGDLGSGTPGLPLDGFLELTAPDGTYDAPDGQRDPVEGQRVGLTLDHGFFTDGPDSPVAGAEAGDLTDLGTTLTGVTDADGRVDYLVGIARDTGFDDDGRVTATLDATAGDLAGTSSARWSTADTLNGRLDVELAPRSEQEGPVGPALAGRRTHLEVTTRDQFGNPVDAQPVDLAYGGDLDDYDYDHDDLVSDLRRDGDLWVVSFEEGRIDVTGTWDAPRARWSNDASSIVRDRARVDGRLGVSFYELDFRRSRFTLGSTHRIAPLGSPVTQTVRVRDQRGNPVEGWTVRFFRQGPGEGDGEAVARRTTNARGAASYTFVGSQVGRARITAEVSDGIGRRTLTRTVLLRERVSVKLAKGKDVPGKDTLRVLAPVRAAGAKVALHRMVGDRLKLVRSRRLGDDGLLVLQVPDHNGAKPTTYVAKVRATSTTAPATSRPRTLR